jgi:uncharacterized coiled-coil DUF342 family protein
LKTRELKKKINRAKYKISQFNAELKNLRDELQNLQQQLETLNDQLDKAFFDKAAINARFNAFFQGWLHFVKNNENLKSQIDEHTRIFDEETATLIAQYVPLTNTNSK